MGKKRMDEAAEKVERAKAIADQAVTLAEYAARGLVAAETLRIKNKPVEGLSLKKDDRSTLAVLPSLSAKHKKNLAMPDADFTVAEVAGIIMAVAEAFIDAEPKQQVGPYLGRSSSDREMSSPWEISAESLLTRAAVNPGSP